MIARNFVVLHKGTQPRTRKIGRIVVTGPFACLALVLFVVADVTLTTQARKFNMPAKDVTTPKVKVRAFTGPNIIFVADVVGSGCPLDLPGVGADLDGAYSLVEAFLRLLGPA